MKDRKNREANLIDGKPKLVLDSNRNSNLIKD